MSGDLSQLLRLHGTLHADSIETPALAGNALGDPATRLLPVYVPPGYDSQGSSRYPVLYGLHGFLGDAGSMLGTRPWEHNVVQTLDRLIASGACAPAILVLVDGWTRLGGSQYVDSIHNGAYATYVARDVVAHVDRGYRTIAHEGGRAVFGKSSGGFGAIHLSAKHPGTFCAFASHSGDMYFRVAYAGLLPAAQRELEKHGGVREFVETVESKPNKSGSEIITFEALGLSAAYSPGGREPFAFELPFDRRTGEIRDDVLERWAAFDPVETVPMFEIELKRLRLRYLDCGRHDEYGLDLGARLYARRLRDHGLTVVHEEFEGGHRNTGHRHTVSLPALIEVMERA